eukprot:TRINITY_DN2156_c0_g1_i1.p1 TRINITY_DN2156_c0_g1~~TRINITY_DN2156_c0_g1_i1.p1  ORF type:complete len:448 (+),score=96.22 TRINITY_DN2156_c0_g1_i1:539-1882(+)
MRLAVLAAALGLTAAQNKPVCFPPVHTYIRLAWASQNDEFDQGRVIADYTNQQFRMTEGIEENRGPMEQDFYQDTLFFPKRGLMYQIFGQSWRDNRTWRCETHQIPNEPPRDPCFTPNGTQAPTNRIGSQTIVDNFFFSRQQNGHAPLNFHIQLTPGGVPYEQSAWNPMGHEVETYLDVNTTLPPNAFAVPSICPPATKTMTLEEVKATAAGHFFGAPRKAVRHAKRQVTGFQQAICIPPVNAVARRAWHDERTSFDTTIEYLDVPNKKARFTDQIFFQDGPNNRDDTEYVDMILDGNAGKIYRITQRGRDVNTRNCTVNTAIVHINDPCFTTNGTHQRTAVVAGSLNVDIFHANNTDRSGIEHYAIILMTQQGVPVQVHHYTPEQAPPNPRPSDHWVELFQDFNTTLPANAFAIPAICNQAGSFDLAALKSHPTLMRHVSSVAKFE